MTGRTGDDASGRITLVKQLSALGGIRFYRARSAFGGSSYPQQNYGYPQQGYGYPPQQGYYPQPGYGY